MFDATGSLWYTGAGTNGALIGRLSPNRQTALYRVSLRVGATECRKAARLLGRPATGGVRNLVHHQATVS